jgi:hypothetical protein
MNRRRWVEPHKRVLGQFRALTPTNVLVVLAVSLWLNFVLVTLHVSSRHRRIIADGKNNFLDGGSVRGRLERSLDRSPAGGDDGESPASSGLHRPPKPDHRVGDGGGGTGYDPKKCARMVNGHCDDEDGGAWRYRDGTDRCTYVEDSPVSNNAPQDWMAVQKLPEVFPDVRSVMDFGGGPGTYLTGLRNGGVATLVTVEPHPLGDCLFANVTQDPTDWVNAPLSELPSGAFDLVMTIEVLEHIPVAHHEHVVLALAQATTAWLLFSAAQPGQGGEGHVGPSMKTREQWTEEIQRWTENRLIVDEVKTALFHAGLSGLLLRNSVIFRKV